MPDTTELLNPDEPAPYRILHAQAEVPVLLVCDHAGSCIPAAIGDMQLQPPPAEPCHLALDIGAGALTERLAERLGATAVLAQYSRLVVDYNRRLDDPQAFLTHGDGVVVQGNIGIGERQKQLRSDALYWPYHHAIDAQIKRLRSIGAPPLFVSVHSFTPVLNGVSRHWEMCVLWDQDPAVARLLMDELRRSGHVVGDNEPYSGKAPQDFTVDHHAEPLGLRHAAIEVRQDFLGDECGIDEMAALLQRCIASIMRHVDLRQRAETA